MANIPLKSIKFPDLPDTYIINPTIAEVDGLQDALDEKADKTDVYNGFVSENIQGSIASFDDGADDIPVKSLVADIVPVQSGSGDPSPDNVRAISGWTGTTIEVADINIWDENRIAGGINGSGANTETAGYYRSDYIVILPNTTYYLKTPINMNVYYYDATKTFISSDGGNNKTFTTPPNAKYLRFRNSTQNEWNSYGNDVSLNYPSTDTSYHAYNGEVHTISFASAGTVYGGSIDVTSGVLTVTDGYIASYAGEALPSTWISDRDVYESGTTPTTGAQVVYKLATPQTYQLTPTEVKTLLGNNNVWADTGDIDLTYRADLGLYLDKIINA